MGKKWFILFLFVCSINSTFSQDWQKRIYDSLVKVVATQKEDSLKAMNLMNIAWNRMGYAQSYTGDYDEAIQWAHKALKLSTKVNYKFGIGRCNHILGNCWTYKGNYTESIKYHTAALNASFINGRKILTAVSYNYIGECYYHLGNYKEALKNFYPGLEAAIQVNAKDLQVIIPTRIGETFSKLGNYQKAMHWFRQAIEQKEPSWEDYILIQMAYVQARQKNYDEAQKNLFAASARYSTKMQRYANANGVIGEVYMQIGEVYCNIAAMKKGNEKTQLYNDGIIYLNTAIPLLKKGGKKENLMLAYQLLSQASEATKDFENAFYYTKQFTVLKDSIYNKAAYLQLADLRMQYEREKAADDEKRRFEKLKMETDALNGQMLAAEKLKSDKKIADEKMRQQIAQTEVKFQHDKLLFEEKQKQERLLLEKKQMKTMLLMGSLMAALFGLLLYFIIRQNNLKKRAIERAEAKNKIAELELQSLRAQLNPHFMFNSLNSIQELILKEETNKSHIYLSRFSKLLRMLLENAEKPFIPLSKELEFLQLYLGLENLRVPDLQYSFRIDHSINTDHIMIPNMILQPYIENAIWHGLAKKQENKLLQIRVIKAAQSVVIEVEDNGIGRKKSHELKTEFQLQKQSKGTDLLYKRFRLLNKEFNTGIKAATIDIVKNHEVAGTLVTVEVPIPVKNILVYDQSHHN